MIQNWKFFYYIAYYISQFLTNFRHFPPDHKNWAYTKAYKGPKNMGAMGAEGCWKIGISGRESNPEHS